MRELQHTYHETLALISDGALTEAAKQRLLRQARYQYFRDCDRRLDGRESDGWYFRDPAACEILAERLHRFNGELYELKAYCIMPNHVHLLISLANQTTDSRRFYLTDAELCTTYVPLCKIMQLIKGGASRQLNQYLGRSGRLWQKDSYDHFVRHAKAYDNILHYILSNPQAAGLVSDWKQYPYLYHV